MPESQQDHDSKSKSPLLDLSSLSSLSLGPNWGSPSGSTRKKESTSSYKEKENHYEADQNQRRDRRGDVRPRRPRREESPQGQQRDREREREAAPFRPVVEAHFYPDDAPFKALTQHIKNSCRTFELFEIARLILDKADRFVCVVKHPEQRDGEPPLLWACVPDGLPFESETEALNHAFTHYLGQFFDIEEVEVDPPAGSFQVIHRCGFTGELIAPPNYHRYQALCQQHHAQHLPQMSFERFQQRIESIRDEEQIKVWLDMMRKQKRFTLKAEKEEDRKVLETIDSARLYLLTHQKDKLVRPAYSARFAGKDVGLLPAESRIRKSIEFLLATQQRFPLDTANHLRGRLRRLNFAVYKKGSKGVSYVCAVKRRFREPNEVLSENLTDLMGFVEAHPNIKANDLPAEYLGIQMPAKNAEGEPDRELEPRDRESLSALMRDLRYLVTSGYLIEYSDGRLYASPPRQAGKSADDDGDDQDDHAAPQPTASATVTTPVPAPEPVVQEQAEAQEPAKVAMETPAAETVPEVQESIEEPVTVAANEPEKETKPE